MVLVDLLSMVATVSGGTDISMMSVVDDYKIVKMVNDITMKRQGQKLSFRRFVNGFNKPKIDYKLLSSDFKFAPYILFTYQNGEWKAEETTSPEVFERMLRMVEQNAFDIYNNSNGIIIVAVVGADQINNGMEYTVNASNEYNGMTYKAVMVYPKPLVN